MLLLMMMRPNSLKTHSSLTFLLVGLSKHSTAQHTPMSVQLPGAHIYSFNLPWLLDGVFSGSFVVGGWDFESGHTINRQCVDYCVRNLLSSNWSMKMYNHT
jgi:hypothetical protein